jgi:manganese/iron transport system ATP-binding protein
MTRPEPVRPAGTGSGVVVRFRQVEVAYGSAAALRGVDGEVVAGQALALIGPNGGGKSTLIKATLGLVPLASGRIEVLNRSPEQARSDVAYVPQADTLDPDFPVSVRHVVLMGRYRRIGWLRRPGPQDHQIAADALAQVGLGERARDRFGTLSGGQRQRVLLARAIAQQARLLLLDEPFSGVDVVSQQTLVAALDRLRAAGTTVIVSTHDLALARRSCDVVCLINCRQFGFGGTEGTLTASRLRAAYGGTALELGENGVIVVQP